MIKRRWNRLFCPHVVWRMIKLVTVLMAVCSGSDARGQFFRSWSQPGGGSYASPFNWNPAGVPDADDGAGFGLNSTYTVTFFNNQTTGTVTVSNGSVTFDLNTSGTARTLTVPGTLTVTGGALTVADGTVDPGNISVTAGGILLEALTATVDAPDGTVTVSEGSAWTKSGPLLVGDSGEGTLLIEAEAEVFSDLPPEGSFSGVIAAGGGSTGSATVTGAGSTWTNNGGLNVGDLGEAALTISDGGSISNELIASIGTLSGSSGEVTVTGEDSSWTNNSGFLRVGDAGNGTLTVQDGGMVHNSSGSAIGRSATGSGMTTVSGSGSLLNVDATLTIGQQGNGTLLVEDGGDVENVLGRVAFGADSVGTATITGAGSTWTNEGELRVGESGDGSLVVEAGGHVSNTIGTIGFGSGSIGVATVTGTGSTWTNSGQLRIGQSGEGMLTIANGGSVSNTVSHIGDSGSVTVTGDGSSWTNSDEPIIDGMLTIDSGGDLTTTSGATIGTGFSGAGTVVVDGAGSTWSNSGGVLDVGDVGEGILVVRNGAQVSTMSSSSIGSNSGAMGTARVAGTGATWNVASELNVGLGGMGDMRIEFGGHVISSNAFIGRLAGAVGKVTVGPSFSPAWTVNGSLSVGGNGFAPPVGNGGQGILTVVSGTVDVTGDTFLYDDGIVSIQSGRLATETTVLFPGSRLLLTGGTLATSEFDFQGGQFQWTRGTLQVDTFDGNLTNPTDGILAPGRSAGGTTIFGDYTQTAGATLQIEIGGTATSTEHDFVDVNGAALLGGSLELALIDDFVPDPADEFIVFNADDLSGFFSNAGNGQRIDTVDGIGSFLVHYGPTSMFIERQNQIVLTDFKLAALPGDFDLDGDVDGRDFLVWQQGGSPDPLSQSDLADWQTNYGREIALAINGTAVPEPSTWAPFLTALACVTCSAARRI